MSWMDVAAIVSRWLHVIIACLLIGGIFFMRVLLVPALRGVEPAAAETIVLRCRRAFKMIVHPGVLLLILTGSYNAVRAWPTYNMRPGITHGIFGLHVLLGLAVMILSLIALAGREPRRNSAGLMKGCLVLMVLTVAAASTLKWTREWAHDHPAAGHLVSER